MYKTTVSIIIATFNAAKTLRIALDSVLTQSYKNWECIIIDGVSQDNTINIIKDYVAKDSRFQYISEPDNGIYDAFNKGWQIAKGEWVHYLGADDALITDGIESLINYSEEADVVYGNTILKFPSGKLKKQYSNSCNTIIKKKFTCCHQSLIMRKKIIEKLGGFDEKYIIISDYDLLLRAYLAKYRFKRISSFIAFYFVGGISSDNIKPLYEYYSIYKENSIKISYIHFVYRFILIHLISFKHKYFD